MIPCLCQSDVSVVVVLNEHLGESSTEGVTRRRNDTENSIMTKSSRRANVLCAFAPAPTPEPNRATASECIAHGWKPELVSYQNTRFEFERTINKYFRPHFSPSRVLCEYAILCKLPIETARHTVSTFLLI